MLYDQVTLHKSPDSPRSIQETPEQSVRALSLGRDPGLDLAAKNRQLEDALLKKDQDLQAQALIIERLEQLLVPELTELQEKQDDLQAAEEEIELEEEVTEKTLQQKFEALQRKHAKIATRLTALISENTQTEAAHAALQEEHRQLLEKYAFFPQQVEKLKAQVAELSETSKELKAHYDEELEQAALAFKQVVEEEREKIKQEAETEKELLRTQLKALEEQEQTRRQEENDKLRQKELLLEKNQRDLESLNIELTAAKRALVQAKRLNADLEHRYNQLEAERMLSSPQPEPEVIAVEKELDFVGQRSIEPSEAEHRHTQLQQELEKLQQERQHWLETQERLQKENAQLKESLSRAQQTVSAPPVPTIAAPMPKPEPVRLRPSASAPLAAFEVHKKKESSSQTPVFPTRQHFSTVTPAQGSIFKPTTVAGEAEGVNWAAIKHNIERRYAAMQSAHFHLQNAQLSLQAKQMPATTIGIKAIVTHKPSLGRASPHTYAFEIFQNAQSRQIDLLIPPAKTAKSAEDTWRQAEVLIVAFIEQGQVTGSRRLQLSTTTQRELALALTALGLAIQKESNGKLISAVSNSGYQPTPQELAQLQRKAEVFALKYSMDLPRSSSDSSPRGVSPKR